MSPTADELLHLIRMIARHPRMFSLSPDEASGMVEVLAAVALAQNSFHTFSEVFPEVGREIVPLAMPHIEREANVPVRLCDESVDPRRASFEALENNIDRFLAVLASRGIRTKN
jgi:hypothetical protein